MKRLQAATCIVLLLVACTSAMATSVSPTGLGVEDLLAEFVNTPSAGSSSSGHALVVAVPEPSAGVLLLIDFASVTAIGLFFRRRFVKR